MRRNAGAFALLGLALIAPAACGRGPNATATLPPPAAPPMIARADLFGDPARTDAKLSPRGEMIAFLAPRNGALNLWVVPTATLGVARAVTQTNGVVAYAWAEDARHLLYLTDDDGNEDFRLYSVDVTTGETATLSEAGHAEIVGVSPADPSGVIVALNERDRAWPDLFRMDVVTGSRTLIERNTRRFFRYVLDRDNRVRLGLRAGADGGVEIMSRAESGTWSVLMALPFEDALTTDPIAFEAGGRSFLMYDSTGRDRAALVRVDVETGAKTVLGESARADVSDVWRDPASGAPEAFAADYLRREWRALDPEAQADLTFLDAQLAGDPRVTSRTVDDKYWIVVEDNATTAARSYLYDRSNLQQRRLTLLFRHRPSLESAPLQPMIPVEIEARDGLTLVSYLTLPIGSDSNGDSRPDEPTPLVILPHATPWGRDSFGFHPLHQWLANRGYAALSVNFRGSSGFGKAFVNAGAREWGGRMQDDLLDAVQWAVEEGIAQPERIAILGAGYGGYAALVGLTATPQRFACAVDIGGPASLESLLTAAPTRDDWLRSGAATRIGDVRTPEGRDALRQRSPTSRASAIERPLLMAYGGRDPRTPRGDVDVMAQGARRAGAVYLNYPDASAVFARTPTRVSFFAVADAFLSGCLGGRAEPMGQAFAGVRAQALIGANRIEGLARAAPAPAPPPQPAAATGAELTPTAIEAPALTPEPAE